MRYIFSALSSRLHASCLLALVCLAGCASAQRDTMLAEVTLGKALSMGYRTVDGIDDVKVQAIRAELQAGDKAKANADYVAYKPKIEKARSALNAGDDTLQHAEDLREAVKRGTADMKDYTAWLPALTAAAVLIQAAIADVKGMLP